MVHFEPTPEQQHFIDAQLRTGRFRDAGEVLRAGQELWMRRQPPQSYEAALEELEKLLQVIESGQLPLEQLLTGYKRGAELLAFCRGKLEAVEQQIKILDEGALKPWTPQ